MVAVAVAACVNVFGVLAECVMWGVLMISMWNWELGTYFSIMKNGNEENKISNNMQPQAYRQSPTPDNSNFHGNPMNI